MQKLSFDIIVLNAKGEVIEKLYGQMLIKNGNNFLEINRKSLSHLLIEIN
jgi:hypothetical protein